MAAEVPFHGDAVLWRGLNGVDSHSLAMIHLPLLPYPLYFLENRTLSLRGNAIGSGLCRPRNVRSFRSLRFIRPFGNNVLKQF